ncbi:MAG TPA: hypothetical protein VM639_24685 [Dongiaceae bacterium]|nr:hypothetical protein [Dongiaceae bacterium]
MNIIEARQAVKQYVTDHWTTTPVVWPNPARPGKGPPKKISDIDPHWIALELLDLRADTGLGEAGSRFAQDDGLFIINAFAPVMTEEDAIWNITFQFSEMFRALKLDGLQFMSPRIQPSATKASDDGAWYALTATVPFMLLGTV